MKARDFILSLPDKVNASAIEGHNTRFHFDIDGEDGGQYTVAIVDGSISAEEGLNGEPSCTVKAKTEHLAAVLSGDMNPMTAVFTGKLKISNPGEMMKYAKIFGLM